MASIAQRQVQDRCGTPARDPCPRMIQPISELPHGDSIRSTRS